MWPHLYIDVFSHALRELKFAAKSSGLRKWWKLSPVVKETTYLRKNLKIDRILWRQARKLCHFIWILSRLVLIMCNSVIGFSWRGGWEFDNQISNPSGLTQVYGMQLTVLSNTVLRQIKMLLTNFGRKQPLNSATF